MTEKTTLLVEALPYIKQFWGTTVVVKYGGNAMTDPDALGTFAEDIVLMHLVGMKPVVVHGGGPQISELMRRLGKEPEFVDGLRVTDAETVDIARMALVGKVNRDIVAAVNRHGPYAVGLSGADARLLETRQKDERLGYVGEIEQVNTGVLTGMLREDFIPVVATMGTGEGGETYNVNADTVAGAIASALGAEKLIYLTDVPGLYGDFGDDSTFVSETDAGALEHMIEDGKVTEGMIPKLRSCIDALKAGVQRAHLLDGRVPHALLLELFTNEGVGTMVTP